MNDLVRASELLKEFKGESLRKRVSRLEGALAAKDGVSLESFLAREHIGRELLAAALLVKHASSQINEIVHALGIVLALPSILADNERVESLSLAAGNTGKGFDVETSRRVAEFTFIEWQGGPEVMRQNKVFKDFYFLAEADTSKRKELYAVGTSHVLAFLNSGRAIPQILKGNAKLGNSFRERYGGQFAVVRDYYQTKKGVVRIKDIRTHLALLRQI